MRKICAIIITLILVLCTFALTLYAANKWGDITTDGLFDINDSVKMAQHLAGWSVTLTPNERRAADVYYDGIIDSKDAVIMAQSLADWKVVLGNGAAYPAEVYSSERDIEIEAQDMVDALIIYPEFPEKIRRNYDYDVSVTVGDRTEKLPVYNHTMEYNCARRPGMDMYRRFSMFAFDGVSVRVDIKVKTDFTSYLVFPSAKNFEHSFNSETGVISVYLDKPDYFGIQLDDNQNSIIQIFADYPETGDQLPSQEEIDSGKVITISGWYTVDENNPYVVKKTAGGAEKTVPGVFYIDTPGTVVYVEAGAVLNARVVIAADNCRLIGRGAIVDPFENIYEYDIRDAGTEGTSYKLVNLNKKYGYADGLVMLDARCYNMQLNGSYNTVRNMKALSTMMTTDGITLAGSGYHTAEHCWLNVGDNGIVASGKNTYAKDITIGTTCAAIFPQGSPVGEVYEDINVFRADDGVITNRYNGSTSTPASQRKQQSVDVTFTRLCAVDLPSMTSPYKSTASMHLFQGANMGELAKYVTLNDVSVNGIDAKKFLHMRNNSGETGDLYTDNYTINIRNLYVNGSAVANTQDLVISGTTQGNTFNVSKDDFYIPVTRNEKTVNYKPAGKVYIGSKLIAFNKAPIISGTSFSLPSDEICEYLRRENGFLTEYVTASELKTAGLISASNVSGGNLYLTPKYNGENLLLPDTDEISHYSEHSCYQLDLVTETDADGTYYSIYPFNMSQSLSAGMSRYISDEVKMYGTGTYKLTFKAKCNKDSGKMRVMLYKDGTSTQNNLTIGKTWETYSVTFTIDNAALNAYRCLFVIMGGGSNLEADLLDPLSVRDLVLTKTN